MCGFIGAATTQIYTYCHPLSLHDALPIFLPANTWRNGNTASAPVLAAYVPGLSLQRAQALIAERDGGHWFINRGDFVNRLRMPELEMTSVKVGITSDWFRLRGQARSGQRRVVVDALLHRSQDRMKPAEGRVGKEGG